MIELTKAVGGTTYLSGNYAAGAYQEEEKFPQAGVELRYQDFEHPTYPQPVEPPVHGLSIVDALMNCGVAGTRELVEQTAVAAR